MPRPRTLLMIPGYDEPPEHLETRANKRNSLPGLRAHGFECVMLPRCYEQLRDRIERLAACIEELRSLGYPFPITLGLLASRRGTGDGVVGGDSASLGSRFPTHYLIGPHCNHMNLIGHFDPLVFLWTGFVVNDLVWPHTLRAILRFTGAKQLQAANP